MPVVPFVPLIASGIGLLAGRGSKPSTPAGMAGPPGSPADTAAVTGPMMGLAQQATGQGTQLFGQGMGQINKAAGYWGTLLNGSRSAIAGAIAPERAALSDTYRGAQRSIDRSLRGADRDVATGELARQRAGQIGGLALAVRPQAAQQVGDLGRFALGESRSQTGMAADIYGNILSGRNASGTLDLANRKYRDEQNEAFGNNLSKFIVGLVQAFNDRTKNPMGKIGGQTAATFGNMRLGGGF